MKGENMTCPKCEEGILKKIQFKNNKKIGFVCETCNTFWFSGETISKTTGHVLEAVNENDIEYIINDLDSLDDDHKKIIKEEGYIYEKF